MSPADPIAPRRGGSAAAAATPIAHLLLVLGIAFLVYRTYRLEQALDSRLMAIESASEKTARTLELVRIEAEREMRGVHAIIAQIEHWAPQLTNASTAASLLSDVRKRLEKAVELAADLDAKHFDEVVDAFDENEDAESERWLLRAAVRVDAERGKELCAALVRGTRFRPSGLLRTRAADILLELDPKLAGEAIRDVLAFESTRGLAREVPPSRRKEYEEYVRGDRFPQFLNFIERFVRSAYPDIEGVLREILASNNHDRMTYQEVVKQLGKLESTDSVDRIKALIEKPPFGFQHPLFEAHCLQALADIQGADARSYLEDRLALPGHEEVVVQKLQTLLKQI